MNPERLVVVAKILTHEIQKRGYSRKQVLDLTAKVSPEDEISATTLDRFLRGDAVWERTLISLIKALELNIQQVFAKADNQIAWFKAFKAEFFHPSSLHLLSGDGFAPHHSPFFFPLELKSYHRPTRRSRAHSPLSALHDSSTPKLSLKQFKKQILKPYSAEVETPCRIAIIGSPGSGKTSVLQNLGSWVFEELGIAILIPLSDLDKEQSIYNYLFTTGFKKVLGKQEVSEADRSQLADLLKEEPVWLLLDGVDEVANDSLSLKALAAHLDENFSKANIVISCRQNIWEIESNPLRTKFTEVYSLQPLSLGTGKNLGQVGAFIRHCLPKPLAQQLIQKLLNPKYAATLALATSPLLLTLLCYTCYRWEGNLPDTRDRLYQKFVEYLYSRKLELPIPDRFQQLELNRSLGILAFRAIDETNSPYRLSSSFVHQVWKEEQFDPEHLVFLEKVGLLIEMGVAKEVPDEKVYTFLHPSMQEYFAIFATDRFFALKSDQVPLTAINRFLQKRWQGVFLFLIGSDQIDRDQKETLLATLIDSKNYCNDYYYHSAVCFAAEGIAEFKKSQIAKEILHQIIAWSLEGWNLDERQRDYFALSKSRMATKTLALSDTERVVEYLSQRLKTLQANGHWVYAVATKLASLEQGRAIAIETSVRLLEHNEELIRDNAAHLLVELAPEHPVLHQYLNSCLSSDSSLSDQLVAIELLHKTGFDTPHLVERLVNLYETSGSQSERNSIGHLLSKIAPNHPFAIAKANLEKIAVLGTASTGQVDEWLEQLEFGNWGESDRAVEQLCTWLYETQNIEDLLENKAQLIRVIQVLRQWLNPDRDIPDFESLLCNQALYRCAQVVPHHIFCEGWNRTENP